MKKAVTLTLILAITFLFPIFLLACNNPIYPEPKPEPEPEPSDELVQSRVRIAEIPQGVDIIEDIEVYLEDELLPLYAVKTNTSQVWNGNTQTRIDSPVGIFELEGLVNITVKLPYAIDYTSKLRPLSAGIIPVADIENSTLSFTLSSTGNYVLEVNNDTNKAIHLFVNDFENYEDLEFENNLIYFGKGLHTRDNNSYINQSNTVNLSSNTTVYIDKGAVVRAKFHAYNSTNIQILGQGVIDGSSFERNSYTRQVTVPVDFNHSNNITLKDVTFLDPAGWCINFYFIEDSLIDNIKIITSRSNGDGISLQSNQNVTVLNSFVRSWDDNLVVKNYPVWSNRNIEGVTRNILFENCILWTDLAQSMEIGYETVGSILEDVTFRNITVMNALHKPVMSIHNGNNANIRNILFENITVENAQMGRGDAGSNRELIEIDVSFSNNWSSQHKVTALGSIQDVRVKGVKVINGANNIPVTVRGSFDSREGFQTPHYVSGIYFEDISIKGEILTDEYAHFRTNQYANNINFTFTGNEIKGGSFISSLPIEEKGNYTKTAEIYHY